MLFSMFLRDRNSATHPALLCALLSVLMSCASKPAVQVDASGSVQAPGAAASTEKPFVSKKIDDAQPQIEILFLSDLHGHLRAEKGKAGYARVAQFIESERAHAGTKTDVVVIGGGDFAGKGAEPCRKTWDKACFPLVKELGVNVAVLGNGELKRSAAELNELIDASGVPWVSANVKAARGVSAKWNRDFLFTGSKSGGKFWLTSWTLAPSPGEIDLKKAKLEIASNPSGKDWDQWKKKFGATPVVWAPHQEWEQDYELLKQACQNSGLKSLVLLKSNDHNHRKDNTLCAPIFEPGAFGSYVSRLVLQPTGEHGEWSLVSHEFVAMDEKISEQAALSARVQALYKELAPDADEVVAQVKTPKSDAEFAQWAAGAFRKTTHADIAVVNMGAIKSGIEAGALTKERLSMVYPYTDDLMGLDWSTRDLEKSLCASSLRNKDPFEDYGSELVLDGAKLSGAGTSKCKLELSHKASSAKVVMVSFMIKRSKRWLGKDLSSVAFKFGLNSEKAMMLELQKTGKSL